MLGPQKETKKIMEVLSMAPKWMKKGFLDRFFEIHVGSKKLSDPFIETKEGSILFDGKQYSIRIPKRFTELINLTKSDKATIKIYVPSAYSKEENEAKIDIEIRKNIKSEFGGLLVKAKERGLVKETKIKTKYFAEKERKILYLLSMERVPLSTREIAIRTSTDWETAKKYILRLLKRRYIKKVGNKWRFDNAGFFEDILTERKAKKK